jgi:hypothetical protein
VWLRRTGRERRQTKADETRTEIASSRTPRGCISGRR